MEEMYMMCLILIIFYTCDHADSTSSFCSSMPGVEENEVTAVCKRGVRITNTNTALYIDSLLEVPQPSTALCVCNLEIEGKQGVNTKISYFKTALVTGIYFHIEGMGIINPVLEERRYLESNTVIAFNKSTDGNPSQGACLKIETVDLTTMLNLTCLTLERSQSYFPLTTRQQDSSITLTDKAIRQTTVKPPESTNKDCVCRPTGTVIGVISGCWLSVVIIASVVLCYIYKNKSRSIVISKGTFKPPLPNHTEYLVTYNSEDGVEIKTNDDRKSEDNIYTYIPSIENTNDAGNAYHTNTAQNVDSVTEPWQTQNLQTRSAMADFDPQTDYVEIREIEEATNVSGVDDVYNLTNEPRCAVETGNIYNHLHTTQCDKNEANINEYDALNTTKNIKHEVSSDNYDALNATKNITLEVSSDNYDALNSTKNITLEVSSDNYDALNSTKNITLEVSSDNYDALNATNCMKTEAIIDDYDHTVSYKDDTITTEVGLYNTTSGQ